MLRRWTFPGPWLVVVAPCPQPCPETWEDGLRGELQLCSLLLWGCRLAFWVAEGPCRAGELMGRVPYKQSSSATCRSLPAALLWEACTQVCDANREHPGKVSHSGDESHLRSTSHLICFCFISTSTLGVAIITPFIWMRKLRLTEVFAACLELHGLLGTRLEQKPGRPQLLHSLCHGGDFRASQAATLWGQTGLPDTGPTDTVRSLLTITVGCTLLQEVPRLALLTPPTQPRCHLSSL